jgi:hypothetical protein
MFGRLFCVFARNSDLSISVYAGYKILCVPEQSMASRSVSI